MPDKELFIVHTDFTALTEYPSTDLVYTAIPFLFDCNSQVLPPGAKAMQVIKTKTDAIVFIMREKYFSQYRRKTWRKD